MAEQRRWRWRDPALYGAILVVVVAVGVLGLVAYEEWSKTSSQLAVDDAGVPETLPNGAALPDVPEPIAAAVARPVLAVGHEEDPQGDLQRCGAEVDWGDPPTLRFSVISPEGLTVALRGEEAGTESLVHVTCHARWDGRTWRTWASWRGETPDRQTPAGPLEPVCCREDGLAVAGAEVAAPANAAWALQDRETYWLAYRVNDDGLVHPVWPAADGDSEYSPRLLYVDDAGERIAEPPSEGGEEPPPDPGQEAPPAPEVAPEADAEGE